MESEEADFVVRPSRDRVLMSRELKGQFPELEEPTLEQTDVPELFVPMVAIKLKFNDDEQSIVGRFCGIRRNNESVTLTLTEKTRELIEFTKQEWLGRTCTSVLIECNEEQSSELGLEGTTVSEITLELGDEDPSWCVLAVELSV